MLTLWHGTIGQRLIFQNNDRDGDGGAGEKKERKTKAEVVG